MYAACKKPSGEPGGFLQDGNSTENEGEKAYLRQPVTTS